MRLSLHPVSLLLLQAPGVASPKLSEASSEDAYLFTESYYRYDVSRALTNGLGIPQSAIAEPLASSRTRYRTNVTLEVTFPSADMAARAVLGEDGVPLSPLGSVLEVAVAAACAPLSESGVDVRWPDKCTG